jgi:hypothetical protein
MVGEGHAFDMIRRIKEGREASRLRRERANDKLKHLNRANEPTQYHSRRNGTYHPRLGEKERERQQLFCLGNAYYHGSPDSNCRHTLGCIYQINNNKFTTEDTEDTEV